ncbi:hypothetical protein NX059_012463 [Plenodomus lindquistii]|nr:hypothetical protein NX059_012463 [Plenodomus lindquistii]
MHQDQSEEIATIFINRIMRVERNAAKKSKALPDPHAAPPDALPSAFDRAMLSSPSVPVNPQDAFAAHQT